jgi:hypothetical protein
MKCINLIWFPENYNISEQNYSTLPKLKENNIIKLQNITHSTILSQSAPGINPEALWPNSFYHPGF